MATLSKRWLLDVYATPTERRPSAEAVAEALYALQIEATDMDAKEIANSPFGALAVAIVKHLARSQGSWRVVEIDGPSLLDDEASGVWQEGPEEPFVRRPKITDITGGG